jgi:hypothetical protein
MEKVTHKRRLIVGCKITEKVSVIRRIVLLEILMKMMVITILVIIYLHTTKTQAVSAHIRTY